ncbi:hypothetical protein [Umezawaea sp.]|uniref:hypothetical protein n=1 Tax=Umezawaea sp. TaxID=1955258 RepID=UPI002ED4AB24
MPARWGSAGDGADPDTRPARDRLGRARAAGLAEDLHGDRDQVDVLAGFHAEGTDVRHPMAPLGDTPLLTRDALRRHFAAAASAGLAGFRVEDVRVHRTADPEVVVGEFTHRGDGDRAVPGVIALRVREGVRRRVARLRRPPRARSCRERARRPPRTADERGDHPRTFGTPVLSATSRS